MRNGLGKFIFGISRLGRGFACGTRTKDAHLNWFRLRSFCTCRIYQNGSSTCWPTLRSLVSLDGSRKPRFSNKLNTNNRSDTEKVSDELKTTMSKCETHSDPVRWCMGRVLESQRGLRLSSSAGSKFSSSWSWWFFDYHKFTGFVLISSLLRSGILARNEEIVVNSNDL